MGWQNLTRPASVLLSTRMSPHVSLWSAMGPVNLTCRKADWVRVDSDNSSDPVRENLNCSLGNIKTLTLAFRMRRKRQGEEGSNA